MTCLPEGVRASKESATPRINNIGITNTTMVVGKPGQTTKPAGSTKGVEHAKEINLPDSVKNQNV
jgi:hypothetical protein